MLPKFNETNWDADLKRQIITKAREAYLREWWTRSFQPRRWPCCLGCLRLVGHPWVCQSHHASVHQMFHIGSCNHLPGYRWRTSRSRQCFVVQRKRMRWRGQIQSVILGVNKLSIKQMRLFQLSHFELFGFLFIFSCEILLINSLHIFRVYLVPLFNLLFFFCCCVNF